MNKQLTASQTAKKAGLYSLAELSAMTGKHVSTLAHWHKTNPELFRIVCIGAAIVKDKE